MHVGHDIVLWYWQQGSNEHSYTCRPDSGHPYSTNTYNNWYIVRSTVANHIAYIRGNAGF